MEGSPTIEEITRRIEQLARRQQEFQQEITELQRQLYELRRKSSGEGNSTISVPEINHEPQPAPVAAMEPANEPKTRIPTPKVKKEKTPIEEFIGTNLLNKIGIAVLVIGVGIGAEYAIDHNLVSPLTRIVMGYLTGVVLIGLALKLKPKYQSFSAVLLGGGMIVLYFISFAAYNLYHLFPISIAFVLMVLFTAFTVFAALQYNLQVVAVTGLVGAYAVPFLLSDGSGRVVILFSYTAIINIGILVLAFRKNWKQLYYAAFVLTWLIFTSWYLDLYHAKSHLWIELTFSTVFFVIFYTTVLSYKLIRGEGLGRWDIVVLLLNSFLYFGIGYFAIESYETGEIFLGLFTLFNAVLHFIACFIIFRKHKQSKDIFLFAAGLVLVFLTLAVPVQLEGNWVTIIWAGEAALLFWIGRAMGFSVYEKLSYPLIALAFISLVQDWSDVYGHYVKTVPGSYIRPFLNVQFLTSGLTCLAFGWISKTNVDKKYSSPLKQGSSGNDLLYGGIPAILLIACYFSLFLEVDNFWQQRFIDSELSVQTTEGTAFHSDYDLLRFKELWLINYSAIFILILAVINFRWIKNKALTYVIVAFSSLTIFVFITTGLASVGYLQASYLKPADAQYYLRGSYHILIRYVALAFTIPLLWVNYTYTRAHHFSDGMRKAERIFFHLAVLSMLSSELVSGLALAGITGSDKLALSILWGAYALGLIVYGLIKNFKYLRIAAISLFGITLIKLFFYDLTGMGTLAKTFVLIVLGGLLLVASFLYNKFKKAAV